MLVAADWVLPVTGEPIREGAVRVRGKTIESVGRYEDLAKAHPRAVRHEHPGCVLAPGFVNAHTHLSLTALRGLLGPQPFPKWLSRVAKAAQALDGDDYSASTVSGAFECLENGTTAVGDVVYGPEGLAAAADAGLGGVFFWEVLGATASELPEILTEREFPVDDPACGHRARCALSAHTVYTSGPDLIRELHRVATEEAGVPFMMHAAESHAELELLGVGSGPLADVANRLAFGFHPPRLGAVRYLQRLDALARTVLVHCVYLQSGEYGLLRSAAGVVLCPRSNAFLQNGAPPVERIVRSGATVALGTDSVASNADLDVRAEARALRRLMPSLSAKLLLRMMTLEGARVLGMEGTFGQLTSGAQADLAIFDVGRTLQPEEAVITSQGPARAVMSAGVWRQLDGRPAAIRSKTMAQRATRAALKASAALGR